MFWNVRSAAGRPGVPLGGCGKPPTSIPRSWPEVPFGEEGGESWSKDVAEYEWRVRSRAISSIPRVDDLRRWLDQIRNREGRQGEELRGNE